MASPSLIVFSADRAPSLSGEIYRVDPNSRHVASAAAHQFVPGGRSIV